MSDPGQPQNNLEDDQEGGASQGPNLTLIYSLVALALAAAIGLALLIVMPFYRRH